MMKIIEKLKNDKKLLLFTIGFIIATFLLPYITIPALILWWFYKKSKWSRRIKVGLIAFFVGGIIVTGVLLSSRYSNNSISQLKVADSSTNVASPTPSVTPLPSEKPTSKPTPTPSPTPKQYSYEVLERNENNTVENFKVLIKAGDDGKAIAMEVKKGCKKPCNIDIYDDKRALELQKEYDVMMGTPDTTPQQLQSWKQKNYVFVADHFVGYINFELDEYQEYPYKDWYYQELKNKN